MAIRILVADDEPQLLAAYKVCLEADTSIADNAEANALGDALFGAAESKVLDQLPSATEMRTSFAVS